MSTTMKQFTKPYTQYLKVDHPKWTPVLLPWDLNTIFDLGLTQDDIIQLELGIVIQQGEVKLYLQEELD